jgi:hypothetical protein
MAKDTKPTSTDVEAHEAEDVEGNSYLIGASTTSDLARIRSREVERSAREHARVKEAKDAKRR